MDLHCSAWKEVHGEVITRIVAALDWAVYQPTSRDGLPVEIMIGAGDRETNRGEKEIGRRLINRLK